MRMRHFQIRLSCDLWFFSIKIFIHLYRAVKRVLALFGSAIVITSILVLFLALPTKMSRRSQRQRHKTTYITVKPHDIDKRDFHMLRRAIVLHTPCRKNVPRLVCYNFDTRERILIFFGRYVTDKVIKRRFILPPQITCAYAL